MSLAHSTPTNLWLVTSVIATHVDRDNIIVVRKRGHLMTPAVPALREAVEEQHQRLARLAARRHSMQPATAQGSSRNCAAAMHTKHMCVVHTGCAHSAVSGAFIARCPELLCGAVHDSTNVHQHVVETQRLLT